MRGYVSSYNRNGSFPIIGRQGALCGNVNFTQGYFYATEHAVVVDTFTYTDEVWATYFLIQLNLNQYATATAQPGLSVKKISEVLMPLPPFQEQKRIVAEIEKWFSFIDNIKDETKELGEEQQEEATEGTEDSEQYVGEEENDKKEDSTQSKEEQAIAAVKKQWGEDGSVTFSVERKKDTKYYVAVKSSNSETTWYEVDIETWEVEEY